MPNAIDVNATIKNCLSDIRVELNKGSLQNFRRQGFFTEPWPSKGEEARLSYLETIYRRITRS